MIVKEPQHGVWGSRAARAVEDCLSELRLLRRMRDSAKADQAIVRLLDALGLTDVSDAFEAAKRKPLRAGGHRMVE